MPGGTRLLSENQHLLWLVGSGSRTGGPAGKTAETVGLGVVFCHELSKEVGGGKSGERKTRANHRMSDVGKLQSVAG